MFNSLDEIKAEVIKRLREQGFLAMEEGMCRYRTPQGLKCAVGVLIPDELYSGSMEGYGVGTLFTEFPHVMETLFPYHLMEEVKYLLIQLQNIHDTSVSIEQAIKHMEELS